MWNSAKINDLAKRTGIEVSRRRPLVISRKSPLPGERCCFSRAHLSRARNEREEGKKVTARALRATRISLSLSLLFINFCRGASKLEMRSPCTAADRSPYILCLRSANLILSRIDRGLDRREALSTPAKYQFICNGFCETTDIYRSMC